MLPLPFIKYIPRALADNIDARGQAFVSKMESIIEDLRDDIFAMDDFKNPEKCYSPFLAELGAMFSADLHDYDTDRIKRQKCAYAVRTHKNRGLWLTDVKVVIDRITGFSASLMPMMSDEDDFMLVGDGALEVGTSWAMLEGEGVDPYGIYLCGDSTEYVNPGIVWIDLGDGGTLPVDTIQQVKDEIEFDTVPAYFRVYLGYTVGTVYTAYTQIG